MLAWDILIWDVLETISIPPDAASDLWPRLWAWFQFMDMYRDHLSGMHPLSVGSEKEMLSDVVSFAWRFAEHKPTIDRITTTPGLYAVATRTWSSLLEGTELREHELFAILTIITPSLGSDPDMLEQLAEGAGGSFVDLASLVTKHFHRVVGKGDIHVTGNAALLALRFLNTFVARIEEVVTEDLDARHFFLELLRKDVIQCLCHTVLTLCGTPDPSEGINTCFVLLRRILRHRPTMGIILDEALGRGLHVFLRSIIHCGLSDLSATHDNLNSFLLLFLPSSMMHHRTLLLMQIALKDLHYLTSTVTFQGSVIFRNWTYFTSLVESQFSLWNDCNRGLLARLKTCDNIKCNYIGEYNELERCSGCKNVYYCCWGCQIIDWTEGGHRQSCSLHRSLGLSSGCGLASRERSYIRALLHQEHLAQKFEIYNDVVLCLRKFPDAGYFVMFDYTSITVTTAVYSLAADDWGTHTDLRNCGPEWADYVARAARSKGCLTIHVMCYQDGGAVKYWVVPLRSNTSAVDDTLRRIAADSATSSDDTLAPFGDSVKALISMSEDEDFKETH